MIKNYFDSLLNQSPRANWTALLRKLFESEASCEYTTEIFLSPKHMRSQRLYDFFHRYITIARHHSDWSFPGFQGATIVELGPGPLMGWGPLAVFDQCEMFIGIEPSFNQKLLEDSRFTDIYLLGVHRDLCALYNQEIAFVEFQKAVEERIVGFKSIESLDENTYVDIMLSNSCLEHIIDLKSTINTLYQRATPGSVFLHCVDFGSHLSKTDPFSAIYSSPPTTKGIDPIMGINFLRPPDILDIFRSAGFIVECIPYYSAPQSTSQKLSSYWSDNYSPEELFLKVGIFVGAKPVV